MGHYILLDEKMWNAECSPPPVNNFSENGLEKSTGNGFFVGRGRGFGNMSSMSKTLPQVGTQSNGATSNQSGWDDGDWGEKPAANNQNSWDDSPAANNQNSWDDSPAANNQNSWNDSNNYQKSNSFESRSNRGAGSGGRSCYNCGEDGHMSRDCPTKRGAGNSGSRGGSCYKCHEEGHIARDCPNADSGGRSRGGGGSCYKCNEEGHMARDCPNAESGGRSRGGSCYKCNEEGHMARDCPNAESGGRSRGGSCYKCNEEGHMARDCPNADSGGRSRGSCYKCNEEGHMARDCPNAESGGRSRGGSCYKCNEEGHMARDCPNADSGGRSRGSCYKCNEEGHMARDCPNADSGGRSRGGGGSCFKCNEEGHMARDCPNADSGGRPRGGNCYKCNEEGHLAKDCTKEVLGEDGKPRPPPYIPPDPSEDAETLFQGVPTGINFSKYDTIHVDVTGSNAPPPLDSFENSGLNGHLLNNITQSKYVKPTPVQKYAIPIISSKRDLMACAQTGSGKTAAFLIPIINELISNPNLPNNANNATQEPYAVIIAPTRELAIQIGSEARKFAFDSVIKADVVYGGTSTSYQSNRIRRGCHILAATPGRLLDFVEKGKVSFAQLRYLVLDEADRMLDMGFLPAIRKMVENSSMPERGSRQTLMFSATFPAEIQTMAAEFMHNYLFLTVGMVGAANADVEQTFFKVQQFDKRQKLLDILKESGTDRTLVFVEQKRNADFTASLCSQNNIPTTSIHGDRLQREREEALRDFRDGKMPVLVATAVAARGLDIRDVRHVINYDLPQTIDEYVHRIGRTGRVGNLGKATSFYDPENDGPLARSLKKILIDAQQPVPDWLSEEADMATDTSVQYGGRGSFGARDVRNKGRGRNFDSNNAFDNEFQSAPVSTYNDPGGEDTWD
ncbi:ATP-dependent RNA helicase vasa [Caerostris darwini]|uniref:RNA helicase n=1 Tax=Caerostris darwini TaxID=1538125 RepID=A0AAV4UEP5_9ARAC|nr:ATP-dependent RNA helicase vasa [Caerostris darwini]